MTVMTVTTDPANQALDDALARARARDPSQLWTREGDALVIELHDGQWDTWDSLCRMVFMLAGTQGGKTSFGPWWLNREITECGSGDYLAVTSTYDLFKLKMLPEIRSVFEFTLGIGRYWAGDKLMEIRDPSTGKFWANTQNDPMWARIILRSAASPAGLEAATAKAAWLDEVGQDDFRIEAWEAVLRRLSLNQGRILGTTTLYNLGWLKTQIFDPWKAGVPHIDVIQFASILNPAFPREEFAQAKLRLPAWKFSMFYEGDYARPASLIYKAYEEGIHLVDPFPIPANWRCFVGIDYGAINNALIWVAEDPEPDRRGELSYYIFDDPLRGNRSTREHVWAALKHDHADQVAGWWGGAPSEQQERWDWAQAGIRVQRPPISSVEPGIDRVIALFKQKRLFVFRTCTGLRDELGTYGRVLDASGEPTEKIRNKNDFHRLDALRYAVAGMTRVKKKARSWEL